MDPRLYPLTFTPRLRDYVWGGRSLETLFGRDLPPGPVAESWEISGYPRLPTVVDSGEWAGSTLVRAMDELGVRLVGTRGREALSRQRFPLLVKLLDARTDLSVQVHPPDAYAAAQEGDLGKSEAWYILHAALGARLICGLAPGVDRAQFAAAMREGSLAAALHYIPVTEGDVVYVPAGTVHAIMAGIVAVEIQQSSDATYRLYDWGRVSSNGDARALHIAKALDVIDWNQAEPALATPVLIDRGAGYERSRLVACREFMIEAVRLDAGARWQGTCDGTTFEVWGCIAGAAHIDWAGAPVLLPRVRFGLLPASLGSYSMAADQSSTLLRVYLPEDDSASGSGQSNTNTVRMPPSPPL